MTDSLRFLAFILCLLTGIALYGVGITRLYQHGAFVNCLTAFAGLLLTIAAINILRFR